MPKGFHVLEVQQTWDAAEPGGIVSMLKDLIHGLEPTHRVTLLTPRWTCLSPTAMTDAEGRPYFGLRLPVPPKHSGEIKKLLTWLIFLPLMAWRLARFCRQQGVTVAHLHYAHPMYLTFAMARLFGGPEYMITTHRGDVVNFPNLGPLQKWAFRLGLQKAAVVVSVSQWLARETQAVASLPHPPRVIYNGFTPPAEAPTEAPLPENLPDAFAVLVGNCRPYKGQDIALRAWQQLAERDPGFDLPLVLVGGGPDLEAMQALAGELGLDTRVMFTGSVDRQTALAITARARLYIAPSRSEGQGIVILEAASAGVPVVCSDIPPFLEMVSANASGFVFESEDIDGLANAVQSALAAPETAQAYADTLKARVETDFSVARMVAEYERLLADISAAPPR